MAIKTEFQRLSTAGFAFKNVITKGTWTFETKVNPGTTVIYFKAHYVIDKSPELPAEHLNSTSSASNLDSMSTS